MSSSSFSGGVGGEGGCKEEEGPTLLNVAIIHACRERGGLYGVCSTTRSVHVQRHTRCVSVQTKERERERRRRRRRGRNQAATEDDDDDEALTLLHQSTARIRKIDLFFVDGCRAPAPPTTSDLEGGGGGYGTATLEATTKEREREREKVEVVEVAPLYKSAIYTLDNV